MENSDNPFDRPQLSDKMKYRIYRKLTPEEMSEICKLSGVPTPYEQMKNGEFCIESSWYERFFTTYDEFECSERPNPEAQKTRQ